MRFKKRGKEEYELGMTRFPRKEIEGVRACTARAMEEAFIVIVWGGVCLWVVKVVVGVV